MAKEEEKKEKKERYIVDEVPTQTSPMVVDTKENKAYTNEAALAKIMNDIEALKGLL